MFLKRLDGIYTILVISILICLLTLQFVSDRTIQHLPTKMCCHTNFNFSNKVCLLALVLSWIVWDCLGHTSGQQVWPLIVVVCSGTALACPESPSDGQLEVRRRQLHHQVRCPPQMRSVGAAVPSVVSRLGHEEQP